MTGDRPAGYRFRWLVDHARLLWNSAESGAAKPRGNSARWAQNERYESGQCMYDYPKGVACQRDQEGGRAYCSMHPPGSEWDWDPLDDDWEWDDDRARRGGWFR